LLIDLGAVRASLRAAAEGAGQDVDRRSAAVVTDFLERGARGRSRLPGKHGGRPAAYVAVPVVVTDEAGQLARLFAAADRAGVNVEDVTIEHAAGHPVGVVELLVRPELAVRLTDALRAAGWSVHG
jgi:prephenate dehydrogenase